MSVMGHEETCEQTTNQETQENDEEKIRPECDESKTILTRCPSKTELLFKLQPTSTSGMQCLRLPWKSEKVS